MLIFISASLQQKTIAEQAYENSELLMEQKKASNKCSCIKMYENIDTVGPEFLFLKIITRRTFSYLQHF